MIAALLVLAKADLLADAGGGERIVAGDHDDADTRCVAGVDRGRNFGPHRIGERHQPKKNQLRLDVRRRVGRALQFGAVAISEGENAQAAIGHVVILFKNSFPIRVRQRHAPRCPSECDRIVEESPPARL